LRTINLSAQPISGQFTLKILYVVQT